MPTYNPGDRVRLTRDFGDDIKVGDTAVVVHSSRPGEDDYPAVKFDNPRGVYARQRADERVATRGYHCWLRPDSLELVSRASASAADDSDDDMISAAKVREVARAYAEQHGWCSVVDDALREMGALKENFVEVTFTETRVVRLRESDLDKLRAVDDMRRPDLDDRRLRTVFSSAPYFEPPAGAELVSARWTRSQPRDVE